MTGWSPVCGPDEDTDRPQAGRVITRAQAIDRMARGEKCETWHDNGEGWQPTIWSEFGYPAFTKFRIPPEPRRVAREWWVLEHAATSDEALQTPAPGRIHVREVLPGDVVLQKMSEATAWGIACKQAPDIGFMSPRYGVMAFASALGLIGEGS